MLVLFNSNLVTLIAWAKVILDSYQNYVLIIISVEFHNYVDMVDSLLKFPNRTIYNNLKFSRSKFNLDSSVSVADILDSCNINRNMRPKTLSIENWTSLAKRLSEFGPRTS